MADFSIKWAGAELLMSGMQKVSRDMGNISETVSKVRNALSRMSLGGTGYGTKLSGIANRLGEEKEKIQSYHSGLQNVITTYEKADQSVRGYAYSCRARLEKRAGISTSDSQSHDIKMKSVMDKFIDSENDPQKEKAVDDGKKYKEWARERNKHTHSGWCDTFVSWFFYEGLQKDIDNTISGQRKMFMDANAYYSRNDETYVPKTGDVIFFTGKEQHVGILYIGDDGERYVFHGNYSDTVQLNKLDAVKNYKPNGYEDYYYGDTSKVLAAV